MICGDQRRKVLKVVSMGKTRLMKVDADFYKEIKLQVDIKRNKLLPTTMVNETKIASKYLRKNRQR